MEDGHGLNRLFEVSRTLPRGPEAVYAALVDPAARRAWSPGLEGVEMEGGAGGGEDGEGGHGMGPAGSGEADGGAGGGHGMGQGGAEGGDGRGAGRGLMKGAAWTETRRLFGHLQTEHVTVVEARPAERLVLEVDGARGSSRSGTYRYTWTLARDGGGTRVSVACDAGDLSRKGAILVRFLIGPFQRAADEELEALAGWVEGRD